MDISLFHYIELWDVLPIVSFFIIYSWVTVYLISRMTIALINGIPSNSLLDAALILHTYGSEKWGRSLVLGLYWPPPSVFYLEMFRGILHAWTESHGDHSCTSHASGSSQGRMGTPTSQLSILQVISVNSYIKGPTPHREAKCRLVLRQSKSPCHPPENLFSLLTRILSPSSCPSLILQWSLYQPAWAATTQYTD